jgi:hypothetical protein
MKGDSSPLSAHPSGEQSLVVAKTPPGVDLDSFFGPVLPAARIRAYPAACQADR